MPVSVITPPAVEPISLAEAKTHLRVTTADEDSLIGMLITAARVHLENDTGRRFITQTVETTADDFGDAVVLLEGPVQSVVSVTYYDEVGTLQTLSGANYGLDIESTPGYVLPKVGDAFPNTQNRANAVRVRYVAGYGTAGSNVPAPLRVAMLLMIGHLYENREAVTQQNQGATIEMPMGVAALCAPYRVLYVV